MINPIEFFNTVTEYRSGREIIFMKGKIKVKIVIFYEDGNHITQIILKLIAKMSFWHLHDYP